MSLSSTGPPYMSVMMKKNLDEKMRQKRPITNRFRMKLITRLASVCLCISISRDGNENGKKIFLEDVLQSAITLKYVLGAAICASDAKDLVLFLEVSQGNLELCNSIRKLRIIGQPEFGKVPWLLPVPATSTTTTTASMFVDAAITDWLHSYFARKMRVGNTFGSLQSYCGKNFLETCCDDRRCPE
ncbi:hypothetical protein C5167_001463 [Papaver somniferum]|uniref:Uncharacterized protein n=1 Tax=Papaver somniferum TaxID=3469 RepID=A0A4Y7KYN0_PAPSO|nr:hypothetical protein C5167_001463 [Papaver somniferum]